MEFAANITLAAIVQQILVGLSRSTILFIVASGLSLVLGVLLVIPVGGADMPVIISFLNSLSGLAASMTGFVLGNNLLIISGALVGASGLILTQIMCVAMNRTLAHVLFGGFGAVATSAGTKAVRSLYSPSGRRGSCAATRRR